MIPTPLLLQLGCAIDPIDVHPYGDYNSKNLVRQAPRNLIYFHQKRQRISTLKTKLNAALQKSDDVVFYVIKWRFFFWFRVFSFILAAES